MPQDVIILGIESSCDETGAAVVHNGVLLSNVVATQQIHERYGGVVPEMASRLHQQNIIPVVHEALKIANIAQKDVTAIAVTRGPGLMGSLLVGISFAKGMALAGAKLVIPVHHMHAHLLSHFIQKAGSGGKTIPSFPFIGLNVSGGHTQIVRMNGFLEPVVLGQSFDDAAGEAFDKTAKMVGLPYPGGPHIDRLAKKGNPLRFDFPKPVMDGCNFSFSGLKTSVLYFLRKEMKKDPEFINRNINDICASVQSIIVGILIDKLQQSLADTGIKDAAVAGGVAANSCLRRALYELGDRMGVRIFYPDMEFCTDNGAMIALTGYYKYLSGSFNNDNFVPGARLPLNQESI